MYLLVPLFTESRFLNHFQFSLLQFFSRILYASRGIRNSGVSCRAVQSYPPLELLDEVRNLRGFVSKWTSRRRGRSFFKRRRHTYPFLLPLIFLQIMLHVISECGISQSILNLLQNRIKYTNFGIEPLSRGLLNSYGHEAVEHPPVVEDLTRR